MIASADDRNSATMRCAMSCAFFIGLCLSLM
jgi:hypothetical protein